MTLAGLLAWQGALLEVLGDTGTVNLTDPAITDLASTFFAGAIGWIDRDRRASRSTPPSTLRRLAAQGARPASHAPPLSVAGVRIVASRPWRSSRRSRCSTTTAACRSRSLILVGFVVAVRLHHARARASAATSSRSAATPRRRAAPASASTASAIVVFMLALDVAAVGGILAASRLLAVNQSSGGSDLLLLAIAGPVIAGTSLFGGRGSVWAALLGALVIGSISNGMDLLALESSVKFMVTGAVLLVAVVIDALARRRRQATGRV